MDVIRFDLDRLTPFEADEVLWSAETQARQAGRITVLLRIIPRHTVMPVLEVLETADIQARAIVSPDGMKKILLGESAVSPLRRILAWGGTGFVLIMVPFLWQSVLLHRSETALELVRPQTDLAQSMRSRLTLAVSGPVALNAEARKVGSLTEILRELSATLPDDTYLTNLTVKQRHLSFGGLSADAPSLIGRLDRAGFDNATLAGPVMRSPDGKRDVFSARADALHGKGAP